MRETFETKVANAKTLLDVLLIFKDVIMLDTHVASLAYLKTNTQKFNGKYGRWSCKPFPLDKDQHEYEIDAYYFSEDGDNFTPDKMVSIVFMDRNFISNLEVVGANPKETNDNLLHSTKYGVILSLPGIALTKEEKDAILDFDEEN